MATCISCASFSFRRVKPELAMDGIGHCAHRAPFVVHHATTERECERYIKDDEAVTKTRVEWLEKVQR